MSSREERIEELLRRPKGGVHRFDIPANTPNAVVIYARRSKKGGTSVEDQVFMMCQWADEEGWPIAAIVVEHGSASIYAEKDRIHWPAVRGIIEDGEAQILLTWEHARADRKLDGYVVLRRLLIEMKAKWGYGDIEIGNNRLYDMAKGEDRDATASDAVDAEKESTRTSKRVTRASNAMARRGSPTQGFPSWGFTRTYSLENGRRITTQHVNEDLKPVIQDVAQRLLQLDKLAWVVKDLNTMGIKSPTGKPWDNTKLREAIIRPAMAGLRVHRGEVVGRAAWDPILADDRDEAEAIHHKLVQLFKDPERKTYGDGSVLHLCSGNIARCGVCSSGTEARARAGRRTIYSCQKYCVGRDKELVDATVTAFVFGLLSRDDALDLFCVPTDETVNRDQQKLEDLEARLLNFRISAANGKTSGESLAVIEAELVPQIKRLKKRLRTVYVPPVVKEIAGPNVAELWKGLNILQQRTVVRTTTTVTIKPVGSGRQGGPESIDVKRRNYAMDEAA